MKKCAAFAALTLVLAGSPVVAQKFDMTPGLWQHSFSMSSQDGEMERAVKEMQKQLAEMPAEQRKMMEDMLAAQGIGFGQDGTTFKVCLTKEQIERGELAQTDEDCTQTVVEQSKNRYKFNFKCDSQPSVSGSGELHLINSKMYTGTAIHTTYTDGKKDVVTVTQSGKWLSADCGNIKPIEN